MVEQKNKRLHLLGPDGATLELVGGPGADPARFAKPMSVAVAPDGTIYVSDISLNQVVILKPGAAASAMPTG